MRFFVTGGTGFVGRHFVRAAVDAGHEVVLHRRQSSQVPASLEEIDSWIVGELDAITPGQFEGVDCLVHLAAAGVNPAEVSWESCFKVNLDQSLNLWRAAASEGVKRFLIGGSCFEYGKSALRYERVPTDAPLEPTDAYGASKAAATMAASALVNQASVRVVVARLFHIYGEGEGPNRFWPALRDAALAGEDFPMTSGEQVRDFTPVELAARQLLQSCEGMTEGVGFDIRHIGTGKPRTLLEFAGSEWARFEAKGKMLPGEVAYRNNEVMRYVPEI